MTKGAIDAADNFNKLSQRVGMSVESLSALEYAGRLSDVSLETLSTALKRLAVNMAETERGTGEAKDAFEALGIDVRGLTSEQVLMQIADQFAAMEDGAGKTALAVKLFGKSGNEIIPLLNEGSAGLASMRKEAEALGLVLSKDMAEAAERFNDNLTRVSASLRGIGMAIANEALPTLNGLLEQFIEGKKLAGGFWEALSLFGTMRPGKSIEELTEDLRKLNEQREEFLKHNLDTRALDRSIERTKKRIEWVQMQENLERFGRMRITVEDMLREQEKGFERPAPKLKARSAEKVEPPIDVFGSGSFITRSREVARFIEDQFRAVNDLDREIFKEGQEAIERAWNEFIKEADAIEAVRRRFVDLIDPVEKYRRELDQIDELEAAGRLTADQATEARFRINEAIDAAMGFGEQIKENADIAREFGFTFSSAMEDAILSGKRFSDVLRGLAQDLARMVLRKTVTEPLGNMALDWLKSLWPFAKGGAPGGVTQWRNQIVDRPTFFAFARGGVMGEAGPEAIMPLTRGPDGTLGVKAFGGGGGININVAVDASGSRVSGDASSARDLGARIAAAVRGVLIEEKRPGGLLAGV
jgi:DNA-binding Xre family transcriptional regulator